MDAIIKREVSLFRETLGKSDDETSGEISLEFYRKQPGRWLFQAEISPWEIWTIKLNVKKLNTESERAEFRASLADNMTDYLFDILEVINKHEFVPRVPNKSEEDTVFDTSFPDIQPYLFRIYHQATGPLPSSMGTTMKKFLRGSFQL